MPRSTRTRKIKTTPRTIIAIHQGSKEAEEEAEVEEEVAEEEEEEEVEEEEEEEEEEASAKIPDRASSLVGLKSRVSTSSTSSVSVLCGVRCRRASDAHGASGKRNLTEPMRGLLRPTVRIGCSGPSGATTSGSTGEYV